MSTMHLRKESFAFHVEQRGFHSSPGRTHVSSAKGLCAPSAAKRCDFPLNHIPHCPFILWVRVRWLKKKLQRLTPTNNVLGLHNTATVCAEVFTNCPSTPAKRAASLRMIWSCPRSWRRTGWRWRCAWTVRSSSLKSSPPADAASAWPPSAPASTVKPSPFTCPHQHQSTSGHWSEPSTKYRENQEVYGQCCQKDVSMMTVVFSPQVSQRLLHLTPPLSGNVGTLNKWSKSKGWPGCFCVSCQITKESHVLVKAVIIQEKVWYRQAHVDTFELSLI